MIGFTFNGIHSYDQFGIIAKSANRPLIPSMVKNELVIPGKNGTYDFGLNTYENRVITVNVSYISSDINELRLMSREISDWLSQTSYKELIFDDEPDKFYSSKIYSDTSLETFFRLGKANISFECQPLAQSVITSAEDIMLGDSIPLGSEITLQSGIDFIITILTAESSKSDTISYDGTRKVGIGSQEGAYFTITAVGTFSVFGITLNGKTFTYTESVASQTITIDMVNATVKNGSTNKMSKMTGNFLELIPGDNTISITKTGGDVTFTVDFRNQYI